MRLLTPVLAYTPSAAALSRTAARLPAPPRRRCHGLQRCTGRSASRTATTSTTCLETTRGCTACMYRPSSFESLPAAARHTIRLMDPWTATSNIHSTSVTDFPRTHSESDTPRTSQLDATLPRAARTRQVGGRCKNEMDNQTKRGASTAGTEWRGTWHLRCGLEFPLRRAFCEAWRTPGYADGNGYATSVHAERRFRMCV